MFGPDLLRLGPDDPLKPSLNLSAAEAIESLVVDVVPEEEEIQNQCKHEHEHRNHPDDEREAHCAEDNGLCLVRIGENLEVVEELADGGATIFRIIRD